MSGDGKDAGSLIEYDNTVVSEDEEEDDEDDNSNDNKSPNLVRLLNEFRMQWQQELGVNGSSMVDHSGGKRHGGHGMQGDAPRSKEDTALAIFKQGITAEQSGRLAEAVECYRRAVQIVPDIEAKMDYRTFMTPRRDRNESESSVESWGDDDDSMTHASSDLVGCHPAYQQHITHISALPIELMMIILKWVVSDDLDLYSLEQVSMVCRAWYMYARDEELWKLVCTRVWGINRGSRKRHAGSWRLMYIERPHLRFNGVYISKLTYMRQGEKSIYDVYNPWHVVEYYRYIRFFPEGVMLMLTSPEDPLSMVSRLRSRDAMRQGLLRGYYKMTGNMVTGVLNRVPSTISKSRQGYRRRRPINQNQEDQTFNVELIVVSLGRSQCSRLVWSSYSIQSIRRPSGEESVSHFDLSNNSYPPLYFSGVKSYTALSGGPLK